MSYFSYKDEHSSFRAVRARAAGQGGRPVLTRFCAQLSHQTLWVRPAPMGHGRASRPPTVHEILSITSHLSSCNHQGDLHQLIIIKRVQFPTLLSWSLHTGILPSLLLLHTFSFPQRPLALSQFHRLVSSLLRSPPRARADALLVDELAIHRRCGARDPRASR